MQTFLPYPNVAASATVLDWRRLGKQRLEAVQLIRTNNLVRTQARLSPRGNISAKDWMAAVSLINERRKGEGLKPLGWANHACMLMWRNHMRGLMIYFDTMRREWIRRGYVNNYGCYGLPYDASEFPNFIGDERFHASHRSQLLVKDPVHYGQFGWNDQPGLPYIWPGADNVSTEHGDDNLSDDPDHYKDPWPKQFEDVAPPVAAEEAAE